MINLEGGTIYNTTLYKTPLCYESGGKKRIGKAVR